MSAILIRPGFGLAAAALLVLGLIAPTMVQNTEKVSTSETFRGANISYSQSDTSIILITDNSETRKLLAESGLVDMSVVVETSDPMVAASIQTAKLLVDVKGGAMVGYNAESREVVADQLPTDRSRVAERIALAFGALQ